MSVLVKVCDICKKEFETMFQSQKHCSSECKNKMCRAYQRRKVQRFKELEEENKRLREQLGVCGNCGRQAKGGWTFCHYCKGNFERKQEVEKK